MKAVKTRPAKKAGTPAATGWKPRGREARSVAEASRRIRSAVPRTMPALPASCTERLGRTPARDRAPKPKNS